jgi:hypothetical protein
MYVGYLFFDISVPSNITLMMETIHAFETSVYSNESTWRYILEGSHLHTSRRENLKCPILVCLNACPALVHFHFHFKQQ